MDSGLGDGAGPVPKEERVNQRPQESPEAGGNARRAPGAYGSVHPAQERAGRLAERMRESLAAAGFDVDRDFPRLRGDMTVSNEPFLTFGRLSPDVGDRLAAVLAGASPAAVPTVRGQGPARAAA
jgi:hypothetical protein